MPLRWWTDASWRRFVVVRVGGGVSGGWGVEGFGWVVGEGGGGGERGWKI